MILDIIRDLVTSAARGALIGAWGYLTDFWNGIDLDSSPHITTYTGGVITAADVDGVLRSSPANVPCLPGCRYATTVAEGAILGPAIASAMFDSTTDGFIVGNFADVAQESGMLKVTRITTTSSWSFAKKSGAVSSTVIGKKYCIQADYLVTSVGSGGNVAVILGVWDTYSKFAEKVCSVNDSGTIELTFTAESTAQEYRLAVYKSGYDGQIVMFDNFSFKEVIPQWLPTAADDTPLFDSEDITVKPLDGPKAVVKDYGGDTDWQGQMVCPASTNYFWNSPASIATQDITLSTGTWTLTVWGSGSVTSSAGTATGSGYGEATAGTPNVITITVEGTVTFTVAGEPDYVNVEKSAFGTQPIATGAGTATRSASVISRPTAGTALKGPIEGQNWGVILRVWPLAAGQTATLFGSYTDASNYVSITTTATQVVLTKRKAGTSYTATATYTHVAGTKIYVIAYQTALGMGIAVKPFGDVVGTYGTLETADGKAVATIASAYQMGALNSLSQIYAGVQETLVTIPPTLADVAAVKAHMEALV